MKKRLLSLLLALALALTVLPQTALLAEPECAHEHTTPLSQSIVNTRGNLCLMLWNMAGCPEPTKTSETYDDLSDADECYKAALWAIEQKILIGYSDTQFAPDAAMTRGQAVTFLWRYAGTPIPEDTELPFVDLNAGAFYVRAVEWAYGADWIGLGDDGVYFSPDDSFEELRLEATVCEDCGRILETKKVTISEAVTANGVFGENLKWKLQNEVLTVTGSGAMKDLVEEEAAPWAAYKDIIAQVVLPDGLTSIGDGAFSGCYHIKKVTIPGSVRRIGANAFYGCSNLTSAVIPDGVETIGDGAFYACGRLKKPAIPASVTKVGYCVFGDTAYSNDDANWDGGVLYVGDWAVDSYLDLTSAQIRSGTKGLSDLLFYETGELEKVTVPKGVKIVGEGAFADCPNLMSVSLPDSVTSLGDAAFIGCASLREAKIPKGVTELGAFTFAFCEDLKSAEIPAGVMRVGEDAFYGSGNLSSLTVVNRDCVIEDDAAEPGFTLGDPAVTTVFGYAGSTAEAYAKKYGYRFTALSEKAPFVDVPAKAFYENPVAWAVENGITKGVDENHFGPNKACTRGQVVTFLWRAAGSPEPKNAETAFTDVKAGAFYEKAVAWAVEQGITNGTSAATFSPDAACNRGQIVTFLWRFKGSPAPGSTETPFTDVGAKAFYAKAVAWAVENKITNGMTDTTFVPDGPCTRGQVVTFLCRATDEK